MRRIEAKHPLAIRWFHWINFPVLMIMMWSGMLIYWADDVFRVGIGRFTLFHFFPDWFYDTFNIGHRLAEGMAWHFFFIWFFTLNGILYVTYTILSGEWRYLVPNRRSFVEAIQVTLHDLHLSKYFLLMAAPYRAGVRAAHAPRRKFNGAQQIAYTAIILMGGGSLLTGLAIYKPTQFAWLDRLLGGYAMARFEHFWLTIGYAGFFVVHIVQVIKAGWNNFRSMVTGLEVIEAWGDRPDVRVPRGDASPIAVYRTEPDGGPDANKIEETSGD